MKACLIPECAKPAGVPGTAHGWCSTHYTRWVRTGDPLSTLSSLKPRNSPLCSVDGCQAARWAKGYCGTHYQRWRTRGEAGLAERLTERPVGRCSILRCKNPVRSKRLCQAHYLRKHRHGDPLAGNSAQHLHDVCSARTCDREHYALGLCRPHWKVQGQIAGRAARLGVPVPGHCRPSQMTARVDYYGNKCWICREPADQIDHVKPLVRGGSNWPANLRPICRRCNQTKSAKWPYSPAMQGVSA